MSLLFAVEPLAGCWREVDRLAREHWKETEGYRHGQPYNPDWARYFSSDAAGWYFMCTARSGAEMVGYAGMWAMPSMHTQQTVAMEDTFFLLEDYRKGWNAIRFIKFIEAECGRREAVEIGWTDKKGKGKILEFLGYSVVASQFSKTLQHPTADSGSTNLVGAADVRAKSAAST